MIGQAGLNRDAMARWIYLTYVDTRRDPCLFYLDVKYDHRLTMLFGDAWGPPYW